MSEKFYVRRKPAVVQAEQLQRDKPLPDGVDPSNERAEFFILDGVFNCDLDFGDYIITDSEGNRTVCKQEDFEKEYEPA